MTGTGRLTNDGSTTSPLLVNQDTAAAAPERVQDIAPVPDQAPLLSSERETALRWMINVDTHAQTAATKEYD
jgi:hypothetical protein